MRRVDDEFIRLEAVTLRRLLLLHCHTPCTPIRFSPAEGIAEATGTGPPAWAESADGLRRSGCETFRPGRRPHKLRDAQSLPCHPLSRGSHASSDGSKRFRDTNRCRVIGMCQSFTQKGGRLYQHICGQWRSALAPAGSVCRHQRKAFRPSSRGRNGAVQSPSPGSGEKYFSNFPLTPSNYLASAGGSFLAVMFGHLTAYSLFTWSHLSSPRLGIGLDRVGGTFRLAHAAIDALVGVDDEHVLALVEAVDRTHLDAVHVLAFAMQLSLTT